MRVEVVKQLSLAQGTGAESNACRRISNGPKVRLFSCLILAEL